VLWGIEEVIPGDVVHIVGIHSEKPCGEPDLAITNVVDIASVDEPLDYLARLLRALLQGQGDLVGQSIKRHGSHRATQTGTKAPVEAATQSSPGQIPAAAPLLNEEHWRIIGRGGATLQDVAHHAHTDGQPRLPQLLHDLRQACRLIVARYRRLNLVDEKGPRVLVNQLL